jgi:ubiquinone biosynthesis protein COQ4
MTAASVAAGHARLSPRDKVLLTGHLLPWAARAGAQCRDLMSIHYEKHVNEDLEELRQQWRIILAPNFVEAANSMWLSRQRNRAV